MAETEQEQTVQEQVQETRESLLTQQQEIAAAKPSAKMSFAQLKARGTQTKTATVQQRHQHRVQAKAVKTATKEVTAAIHSFETDVSKKVPEYATPEYKATALQTAKEKIQAKIDRLNERIETEEERRESDFEYYQRQRDNLDSRWGKEKNKRTGETYGDYWRDWLDRQNQKHSDKKSIYRAEIRGWQEGLGGGDDAVIKKYYTGYTRDLADYYEDVERADIENDNARRKAIKEIEKRGEVPVFKTWRKLELVGSVPTGTVPSGYNLNRPLAGVSRKGVINAVTLSDVSTINKINMAKQFTDASPDFRMSSDLRSIQTGGPTSGGVISYKLEELPKLQAATVLKAGGYQLSTKKNPQVMGGYEYSFVDQSTNQKVEMKDIFGYETQKAAKSIEEATEGIYTAIIPPKTISGTMSEAKVKNTVTGEIITIKQYGEDNKVGKVDNYTDIDNLVNTNPSAYFEYQKSLNEIGLTPLFEEEDTEFNKKRIKGFRTKSGEEIDFDDIIAYETGEKKRAIVLPEEFKPENFDKAILPTGTITSATVGKIPSEQITTIPEGTMVTLPSGEQMDIGTKTFDVVYGPTGAQVDPITGEWSVPGKEGPVAAVLKTDEAGNQYLSKESIPGFWDKPWYEQPGIKQGIGALKHIPIPIFSGMGGFGATGAGTGWDSPVKLDIPAFIEGVDAGTAEMQAKVTADRLERTKHLLGTEAKKEFIYGSDWIEKMSKDKKGEFVSPVDFGSTVQNYKFTFDKGEIIGQEPVGGVINKDASDFLKNMDKSKIVSYDYQETPQKYFDRVYLPQILSGQITQKAAQQRVQGDPQYQKVYKDYQIKFKEEVGDFGIKEAFAPGIQSPFKSNKYGGISLQSPIDLTKMGASEEHKRNVREGFTMVTAKGLDILTPKTTKEAAIVGTVGAALIAIPYGIAALPSVTVGTGAAAKTYSLATAAKIGLGTAITGTQLPKAFNRGPFFIGEKPYLPEERIVGGIFGTLGAYGLYRSVSQSGPVQSALYKARGAYYKSHLPGYKTIGLKTRTIGNIRMPSKAVTDPKAPDILKHRSGYTDPKGVYHKGGQYDAHGKPLYERPRSAVIVQDKQGRILFIEGKNGLKVLPGGNPHMNHATGKRIESYKDAAIRELHEEVGLSKAYIKAHIKPVAVHQGAGETTHLYKMTIDPAHAKAVKLVDIKEAKAIVWDKASNVKYISPTPNQPYGRVGGYRTDTTLLVDKYVNTLPKINLQIAKLSAAQQKALAAKGATYIQQNYGGKSVVKFYTPKEQMQEFLLSKAGLAGYEQPAIGGAGLFGEQTKYFVRDGKTIFYQRVEAGSPTTKIPYRSVDGKFHFGRKPGEFLNIETKNIVLKGGQIVKQDVGFLGRVSRYDVTWPSAKQFAGGEQLFAHGSREGIPTSLWQKTKALFTHKPQKFITIQGERGPGLFVHPPAWPGGPRYVGTSYLGLGKDISSGPISLTFKTQHPTIYKTQATIHSTTPTDISKTAGQVGFTHKVPKADELEGIFYKGTELSIYPQQPSATLLGGKIVRLTYIGDPQLPPSQIPGWFGKIFKTKGHTPKEIAAAEHITGYSGSSAIINPVFFPPELAVAGAGELFKFSSSSISPTVVQLPTLFVTSSEDKEKEKEPDITGDIEPDIPGGGGGSGYVPPIEPDDPYIDPGIVEPPIITPEDPITPTIELEPILPYTPFGYPDKEKKRKKKKKKKGEIGWDVEIKPVYGKNFVKINPEPVKKEHAKDIGSYIVDTSLSAQFKIKKSNEKAQNPSMGVPAEYFKNSEHKFRSYKVRKGKKIPMRNRWIEKQNKRIDTQPEIRRISGLARASNIGGRIPKKYAEKVQLEVPVRRRIPPTQFVKQRTIAPPVRLAPRVEKVLPRRQVVIPQTPRTKVGLPVINTKNIVKPKTIVAPKLTKLTTSSPVKLTKPKMQIPGGLDPVKVKKFKTQKIKETNMLGPGKASGFKMKAPKSNIKVKRTSTTKLKKVKFI